MTAGADAAVASVCAVEAVTLVTAAAFTARAARSSTAGVARARQLLFMALSLGALTAAAGAAVAAVGSVPVAPLAAPTRLVCFALTGWAFCSLPRRDSRRAASGRALFDSLISASAVFFVAWLFVLEPLLDGPGSGPTKAAAISVPVASVLLISLILAVLPDVRGDVRRLVDLAAGGVFLVAVSNLLRAGQTAIGQHSEVTPADVLLVVGLVVLVFAARAKPVVLPPDRPNPWGPRNLTSVPVTLAVLAGCGYVISGRSIVWDDVPSAVIMVLALVLRQHQSLHDLATTAEASEHAALTDELTGLPNRRAFLGRLQEHLATPDLPPVAVALVDLNGFKEINDRFGHQTGDEVLRHFASVLQEQAGPTDLAARLGGDEFAIASLAPDAGTELHRLCARLVGTHHVETEAGGVGVGCCAGIGSSRPGDRSVSELLRRADTAMYAAKSDPSRPLRMFDREVEAAFSRRNLLASALADAGALRQMSLVYQPIFYCEGRDLVGVEALLRWQHPTLGAIPPSEFIPLAEDTGQIRVLGPWVLAEAMAQAAEWRRLGLRLPRLFVNVSPRQLTPDFARLLGRLLAQHGFAPDGLTLEVTEGCLTDVNAMVILQRVHAMGVKLAIDDFGTGYSSLSQLARLPVDTVKIDRDFIVYTDQPAPFDLLRGIVDLTRTLGMETLIEGVETPAQLQVAVSSGVELAQGFLLGGPMPPEEASLVLATAGLASSRPAQADPAATR